MVRDALPVVPNAVIVGEDRFVCLNYAMLGTYPMTWEEWLKASAKDKDAGKSKSPKSRFRCFEMETRPLKATTRSPQIYGTASELVGLQQKLSAERKPLVQIATCNQASSELLRRAPWRSLNAPRNVAINERDAHVLSIALQSAAIRLKKAKHSARALRTLDIRSHFSVVHNKYGAHRSES